MDKHKISSVLKFFLNLSRINAITSRRFDGHMGSHHGIGFTDLAILYSLNQAPDEKMRRIDLAEKLGLTASGVTRLLAPMEKIGLIKRETTEHDARVSYVTLASGGRRALREALVTAQDTCDDLVSDDKAKKIEELSELLESLSVGPRY